MLYDAAAVIDGDTDAPWASCELDGWHTAPQPSAHHARALAELHNYREHGMGAPGARRIVLSAEERVALRQLIERHVSGTLKASSLWEGWPAVEAKLGEGLNHWNGTEWVGP